MNLDTYAALPGENFSLLKHLAKSPAHYAWAKANPREDTAALRRGRVGHLAILEPQRYQSEVVVWGGDRRGRDWKDFEAANEGMEILTTKEHEAALYMAEAVRNHGGAQRYLAAGTPEQTHQWKDALTGLDMKGRTDWISASAPAIVDIKITKDASPQGFGRECWNYHSYAQCALYQDGVEATTGKRLPCVLIAVEAVAPYAVCVYRITDDVLSLGRELYRSWLHTLVACRQHNAWPGYVEGEMPLSLPRWASGQDLGENINLEDV